MYQTGSLDSCIQQFYRGKLCPKEHTYQIQGFRARSRLKVTLIVDEGWDGMVAMVIAAHRWWEPETDIQIDYLRLILGFGIGRQILGYIGWCIRDVGYCIADTIECYRPEKKNLAITKKTMHCQPSNLYKKIACLMALTWYVQCAIWFMTLSS